jgi:hypothetical protein
MTRLILAPVILTLALCLSFCSSSSPSQNSVSASSDLGSVALEVTILPGASVRGQAENANETLLTAFPKGFRFGPEYVPLVSLLQVFVQPSQAKAVEETVANTKEQQKATAKKLALSSIAFRQGKSVADSQSPLYAPKLTIATDSELFEFQADLVTSLEPYIKTGGTDAAFLVSDPECATAEALGLSGVLSLEISARGRARLLRDRHEFCSASHSRIGRWSCLERAVQPTAKVSVRQESSYHRVPIRTL